MWTKVYYKTNEKARTVLCSVIKRSRKWREYSRSREKHSPATRVHPTFVSCSRHFLACFITEQSTVLAFFFICLIELLMELFSSVLKYTLKSKTGLHDLRVCGPFCFCSITFRCRFLHPKLSRLSLEFPPISELIDLARWIKFNPSFITWLVLIVLSWTKSNRRINFHPRLARFNPRLALIGFPGTGARRFLLGEKFYDVIWHIAFAQRRVCAAPPKGMGTSRFGLK